MKDYIIKVMKDGKRGLYLCELPTGYGKTYNSVHTIKEYLDSQDKPKKVIFLTTLNKNLPEEKLLEAFDGNEKLYHRKVLRIRSNFDEIREKIERIQIPEDFQSDNYKKLLKLVSKYNRFVNSETYLAESVEDIKRRIDEVESSFRKEISRKLRESYRDKRARRRAVHNNPQWKWVGELYPAVFTDEYPILLMSVSKFLSRNSTLVEPSYEFLKSDLITDAIIFIDEFDATKATIQESIIERALSVQGGYLTLFRQLYRGLNGDNISREMENAYRKLDDKLAPRFTFDEIIKSAGQINEKYYVFLSYKTVDEAIDHKQNFLFRDATYHSIFQNGKKYLRAVRNVEENRVDLFYESWEEYNRNKADLEQKDNDIPVFTMLRSINSFLYRFRIFLYNWAEQYMLAVNAKRKPEEDALTIGDALSTILSKFEISRDGQELILSDLQVPPSQNKKELFPDTSFYQKGMEIFELEDQDAHHDNTNLQLIAVYNTPEKMLAYLSSKAILICISATAEIPTVIGNYDLVYLREKLRDQYHTTPLEVKDRCRNQLEESWTCYRTGQVSIHGETVREYAGCSDNQEILRGLFENEDRARVCGRLIDNQVDEEYLMQRYCRIVKAMYDFCRSNMQSMLYLGMALPKKNHPELDEDLLNHLFSIVLQEADTEGTDSSLFILRGDNFEEDKKRLMDRLEGGEKIFIMSSYQTIGAGQNLQYRAPNRENLVELIPYKNDGDLRHFEKDIDGIYLADTTNQTINTYAEDRITRSQLIAMLFQIEELKENSEINFTECEDMIKLAFKTYVSKHHIGKNLLYFTDSVRMQSTRHVMQAVGRMCRTYLKSPDIYIYIEERLLDKVSAGELKKHILSPELEAIVRLREELGKEYSDEEAKILRHAENTSSSGWLAIRRMLSQDWTLESMAIWEKLRLTVLRYPTASIELHEMDEIIRKFYITSGKPQNSYYYSQYADFRDVTIDFGDDPIAFRNSGRAKRKSENGEVYVYSMSEKESGLILMMKYPGLKDYFQEQGYATSIEANAYMMSPVIFHNIYEGALGEVVGKFILEKELGVKLEKVVDPNKFEFFDFKMGEDVYVDFKNWKYSYQVDRDTIRRGIMEKLDKIGGKRAYIINVLGDPDPMAYKTTPQIDNRIIEIFCLIDSEGHIVRENLQMIREEDMR